MPNSTLRSCQEDVLAGMRSEPSNCTNESNTVNACLIKYIECKYFLARNATIIIVFGPALSDLAATLITRVVCCTQPPIPQSNLLRTVQRLS